MRPAVTTETDVSGFIQFLRGFFVFVSFFFFYCSLALNFLEIPTRISHLVVGVEVEKRRGCIKDI